MKIPLLFVSGLLSNEEVWADQIDRLKKICLIKIISPNQGSPQKMVEAILAEAPDQFVLVGHSMGGWLSLEVMRRARERVSKLCLLNTTGSRDSLLKKNKRKEMIERVEKGEFVAVVKELVDHLVFNQKVKSKVEKMFLKVGEEAFLRQEKSMLIREECESILPMIQCPTLVIHAAEDRVFTLEDHQKLVNGIPKATLAIVERCGHMSPMESPEEISSLLRDFLY